jgi:hypothetical protein
VVQPGGQRLRADLRLISSIDACIVPKCWHVRADWHRATGPSFASRPCMEDRSRVLAAAAVGAVVGGLWGWLYLTKSGCEVRDQIEPTIDRIIDEVKKARETGEKAKTVIDDGRRLLAEVMAVGNSA